MSDADPAQPPSADAWVAAVHASEDDFEPLGAGVVVAADRVLTCAHVVVAEGAVRAGLWVAFPKGDGCPRRRVASVRYVFARPVRDVAVLVLEEPVPAGAGPASLRFPGGQDLTGRGWWAFGFPDRDPVGDSADGQVGAALSYGWVRLDTRSRYLIRPGFSGGGLWSPDYQAVVGIVGQAHANGDGRAITLRQADLDLPGEKLAALALWSAESAGEGALAQWGWTLARDPEGGRHWRPRARGVSIDSERGWRFRGRSAALLRITAWLDRARPDRRVLVVTGSPGAGKSAVLGRVVTTADAAIRASLLEALPPADVGVLASPGSVSCAVHAKGKTALEVAVEIARAASAGLPARPEDLAPAVSDVLTGKPGRRFNVIIDALDEAASPAQARAIIDEVVLPLAETCADVGVQVAVGSRRRDDDGDLLDRFGPALELLDLDDPRYFAEDDLAAYALACLRLAGDERPDNPYASDIVAVPLADRIAAVSGRNFLITGLIARSHGLHDNEPADPGDLGAEATVRTALAAYLKRLPDVGGVPAAELLTALAFAEAPGLPAELWQLAIRALYQVQVSGQDLARFARSSAANFLVETTGLGPTGPAEQGLVPVYRLFHQALNDALLHDRAALSSRWSDERSLTRAFARHGRAAQWDDAPDYLLRSLPAHARAGGLADDLLTDDAYLLHADIRRLLQIADDAVDPAARGRVRLLRLTPQAIAAGPAQRAAMFSVTEALDNLGRTYRDRRWRAPYTAEWAAAGARRERAAFKGHRNVVSAVCAIRVDGRDLLASGGDDETVRLWDPRTGEQLTTLQGDQDWVNAVCAIGVDGRDLLASGGDSTVLLWDPRTGEQLTTLQGHQHEVNAVCAISVDGRDLLASGSGDHTVRLWDPRTGEQLTTLQGHQGAIYAVCAIGVDGRDLLASGGDSTVLLWDPRTGEQLTTLQGHQDWVRAVCAIRVDGRDLLASGSGDETVRLWDPRTGEQLTTLQGHQGAIYAVCAISVDGRDLLASGSDDRTVRLWDPRTGEQLTTLQGHQDWVNAVCAISVDGRDLLASGSDDRTVRVWDPQGAEQVSTPEYDQNEVNAVCAIRVDGRDLLASGSGSGDHTVRVRDPRTGEQLTTLQGHQNWVRAVCAIRVDGRDLLASGSGDRTVRLWDPRTGEQLTTLQGHQGAIYAVCAIRVDGRDLLASGSGDETVRLWDPRTGEQLTTLQGHQNWVNAVCAIRVDGRDLLASGSGDRTVRLWDPRTGEQLTTLQGHQNEVNAVCAIRVDGRDLLASGSGDETVRLWDPRTGEQLTTLQGHQNEVNAVCAISVDGRDLLASGSDDRTVRVWDPRTGICLVTVPTHHEAQAVAAVADSLAIGLDTGILVIKLNTAANGGGRTATTSANVT